jgi:hypothetical protein
MHLRAFTLGTLELCRQLGLTMFLDGEVPENARERSRQVAAYLFIQSGPLDEVLSAIDGGTFDRALRLFQFRLTPAALEAAIALIQKNLEGTGAMVVEIEAKPGAGGANEDTPPPN